MNTEDKKLPMDKAELPVEDVKSRRELLAATAKLSAFISAVGLAGVGLSGAANAETTAPRTLRKRPGRLKAQPKLRRGGRLLPAVQKRQMKLLLNDAMRTGDSRTALRRHPNLKLNRRQKAALMRVSKQDWAHLRRLKAQLAPLEDLAAGDTGYVFW